MTLGCSARDHPGGPSAQQTPQNQQDTYKPSHKKPQTSFKGTFKGWLQRVTSKEGDFRRPTSTIWHASGAFRPGADIFEQPLSRSSVTWERLTPITRSRPPGTNFQLPCANFQRLDTVFWTLDLIFWLILPKLAKTSKVEPQGYPPSSILEYFRHCFGIHFIWISGFWHYVLKPPK